MARPKHDNPLMYPAGELALGSGIAQRNVQFLRDNMLGPFTDGAPDNALYDEQTLAHLAIIGGFHQAGLELLPAAQVATAYMNDQVDTRAERLANLWGLERRSARIFEKEVSPELYSLFITGGLTWLHHGLMVCQTAYIPGKAIEEDVMITVADRTFVMTGRHNSRLGDLLPEGVPQDWLEPLCRIEGLARGGAPRAISAAVEYGVDEYDDATGGMDQTNSRRAFEAYNTARENAVGLVTVNMSLAIRNAFDRVHDHRMSKTKLFNREAMLRYANNS